MQQLVILFVINCSSTCFGRLYAHHQEVRLRFTPYGVLSCYNCCDVGESGDKLCALCGVGCLTASQATYSIDSVTQSDLLMMGVKTSETC
jgi:hypothetical protein